MGAEKTQKLSTRVVSDLHSGADMVRVIHYIHIHMRESRRPGFFQIGVKDTRTYREANGGDSVMMTAAGNGMRKGISNYDRPMQRFMEGMFNRFPMF